MATFGWLMMHQYPLTLSNLSKTAGVIVIFFFLLFPENMFYISFKLSRCESDVKSCFLGNIRKSMSSAALTKRVINVTSLPCTFSFVLFLVLLFTLLIHIFYLYFICIIIRCFGIDQFHFGSFTFCIPDITFDDRPSSISPFHSDIDSKVLLFKLLLSKYVCLV